MYLHRDGDGVALSLLKKRGYPNAFKVQSLVKVSTSGKQIPHQRSLNIRLIE